MEKTPAAGIGKTDRAWSSVGKMIPTPSDVSVLNPQAAALLTQAYNNFGTVLERIMAKPMNSISQIPPSGRRRGNVMIKGSTVNMQPGDGTEDGESSWYIDTQNRTNTLVQSTPLLGNIYHNDEEKFRKKTL
ncbi:hypothetical protein JCGZ_03624 [Jatropha curcas]|uniref:Uncharacterized protein n=1 Tax=Jatropha curcas TaxID=180498 RepID=A0A067L1P1_JATCU|nr:hypothetical protein JCGZ_03624 [Jatropha curcas]